MWEVSAHQWKQDVLDTADNKFERRLSEEGGALRLEIAAVRLEIAKSHASTLRWMAAGWLTQMLAIIELATKLSGR
jgi:hypothetical protein